MPGERAASPERPSPPEPSERRGELCECGHDTPVSPEIDEAIKTYHRTSYDYGYFREMPPSDSRWRYCSFREHTQAEGKLRLAILEALRAGAARPPEPTEERLASCRAWLKAHALALVPEAITALRIFDELRGSAHPGVADPPNLTPELRALIVRCEEEINAERMGEPTAQVAKAWEALCEALRGALSRGAAEPLKPFAHFAAMWDANPVGGKKLSDAHVIYGIHTGTQWEAHLTLGDFRRAALSRGAAEPRCVAIREVRAAIPTEFWGSGSKWEDGSDPYNLGGNTALKCVASILDRLEEMPDAQRIGALSVRDSSEPIDG